MLVYALRGGAYDLVAFEEYGLIIWVVLAVGLALGLLPRTRPALPILVLLGGMLAYAGWIAMSLIWSESAERTTTELARTLDYLGLVALVSMIVRSADVAGSRCGARRRARSLCAS